MEWRRGGLRLLMGMATAVLSVASCDTAPPFPSPPKASPVTVTRDAQLDGSPAVTVAVPVRTGDAGVCPAAETAGPAGALAVLPSDRATLWQPGVTYNGGIPCRTKICDNVLPSGEDDTKAINSALSACPRGQVVQLAAGTYVIAGKGLVVPSNVTLRGRTDAVTGRPTTMLVRTDGEPYSVIQVGNRYSSGKFKNVTRECATHDPATCGVDLATDGVKGSRSVTLRRDPGLKAGELVYVDMATNPKLTWWNPARSPGGGPDKDPSRGWFSNYDRPISQVMEVASVAGTTVTFTTPFHVTFAVADGAQLWQNDLPATKWAGVEDVYTFGGGGGDGGGNIHISSCAYCWARNVEVDYSSGTGINLDGTFRSEVRDSYIHTSADPNPGGGGYLTGMNRGAADNLLENNVVWNGNKVIVMRATGGGNVVAYNYMQDAYGAGYPTIPEVGLNASHMTTPHYELLEGNEAQNFDGDSVWGGSIYITVFRNSFPGLRISASPLKLTDQIARRAAGIQEGHWWYSFVGNILGFAGMATNEAMPGGTTGQSAWAADGVGTAVADNAVAKMWVIGRQDGDHGGAAQDPLVAARTLRDGNFDFVTKQTKWAGAPHALPPSLYLARAPAFFGGAVFPWVDPLAGKVYTLPAKARWQAMVSAGTYRSARDLGKGI